MTPSGEFFVAGFFLTWIAPIIWGAIVGTAISIGIYAVQAAINNSWSWRDFSRSILLGAVTGAVSGGLGLVFTASGFWSTVANGALVGAGTGGATALITGQNFLEGVLKGAVIGGVAAASYTINYFLKGLHLRRYTTTKDINGVENYKYDPNVRPAEMQKNIIDMRNENFTLSEKDGFGVGFDQIGPGNSKGYLFKSESSTTLGYTDTRFFTGKSIIRYSPLAAQNKDLLAEVMIHETGHAYANRLGLWSIPTEKSKGGYDLLFDTRLNSTEHIAIYKLEHLYAIKNGLNIATFNGASMWNITTTYNLLSQIQQRLIDKAYDLLYPIFNRIMKY